MLQNEPSSEDDEYKRYLRAINIGKQGVDVSHEFAMWIRPVERNKFRLKLADVLVSEGGDAGRVAVFDVEGEYFFQNAINRVRPLDEGRLFPRYIYYWMSYLKETGYVEMVCNVATIAHFTAEKLKASPFAFPSFEIQKRIVAYLDNRIARIDALIEKKQALLERLAEKRQALITNAVTKGLTPGVVMKFSDLGWVAKIPRHWQSGNIRRFASMKTGHTPSRSVAGYWDDCTIPWFTLSDVWQIRDGTRWYLQETSEKISRLGLENSAAELLPAGTVILSRTASVGFSGVLAEPMATSQDFWNWICGPKLLPEYLLLLFRAMGDEFELSTNGSTHKTIYQGIAAGLRICVPGIEEQRAIVESVFATLSMIDGTCGRVLNSVTAMQDYRSALITAAVTGQLPELNG